MSTALERHAPNELDCKNFRTAEADGAAPALGGGDNLRAVIGHTPFLSGIDQIRLPAIGV
jgi:hypothetical protein